MRAGEPRHELLERARHGVGEGRRQPDRQRAAEGVAVAGGVLGGGMARLAGDLQLDHPPLVKQLLEEAGRLALDAQVDLGHRQVSDPAQYVVQLVGGCVPAARR